MDEDRGDTGGLFDDPEDYYPPTPPPRVSSHTMLSGETITLHVVGSSPLDAHHVWNGSRVISNYFETHVSEIKDKTVLEIGAGAGLSSISAAILGARKVVVTDFPDPDVIDNIRKNVFGCALIPGPAEDPVIVTDSLVWGANPDHLLAHLQRSGHGDKFDVLILADLLFRHGEHANLVKTVEQTMKKSRDSVAFVVFTSYRPWLQQRDLGFFDVARERGFTVEKILEEKMENVMFEEDPGDEDVRKTVTGFKLRWPEEQCS